MTELFTGSDEEDEKRICIEPIREADQILASEECTDPMAYLHFTDFKHSHRRFIASPGHKPHVLPIIVCQPPPL